MKVQINGEDRQVADGTSLAGLLESLELGEVRVAVERNLEIVPKDRYDETTLAEGDHLEIVTFVGGG